MTTIAGLIRPGLLGSAAVLAVVLLAVLDPALFTRIAPDAADPLSTLLAPSVGHWFGTDVNGRD
ncbi:ABC transporter permease, partial [Streptomyces anulatus]